MVTKARVTDVPDPNTQWRSYVYNASDERIGTIILSGQNGTDAQSDWTFRDTGGQVLRRLHRTANGTWSWTEDYIYLGSQLLAAEEPSGAKHFHLDHLGSPRLITDGAGIQLSLHTYYPFGAEAGTATAGEKQFTGHERDSGTLDYMHARYYSPQMGRFLSADPTWDSADIGKPQSWNRYSYVINNSVNATDPDGRLGFLTDNPDKLRQRSEKIVGYAAKFLANFVLPDGEAPLFESGYSENDDKPDLRAAAATGAVVTIGKNAATGKLGEKIVAEQLVAEGKTILGSQVSAQTSQGRRVIDHLVQDATGISAKEVKTGNAVRSAAQVAKDIEMATGVRGW